jgi:hypothetical protein
LEESGVPFWAQKSTVKSIKAIIIGASTMVAGLQIVPKDKFWWGLATGILGFIYICYSEGATIASSKAAKVARVEAAPALAAVVVAQEQGILPSDAEVKKATE